MVRLTALMLVVLACDEPEPEPEPLRPPECECSVGDACVEGVCVGPMDRRGCAGYHYGCAIHEGEVWCWGRGVEPGDRDIEPKQMGVSDAVEIACDSHACARHEDGGVTCWGSNGHGQTGQPETDFVYANERPVNPARVDGLSNVAEIAVGSRRSCARLENGRVTCWGYDVTKPVNFRPTESQHHPQLVDGLEDATRIVTRADRSCAIRRDRSVVCWGDSSADPPHAIAGVTGAVDLAYGAGICALLETGHVKCWRKDEAVEVWGLDDARSLTRTGSSTLCARRANGQAWCWGHNSNGQIGNDSRESRPNPTRVRALSELQLLTGSHELSCAMRDNEVHCWGRNFAGVLGRGEFHPLPKHIYTLGSDVQPPINRFVPSAPTPAPAVMSATSEMETDTATLETADAPHWHCLCYEEEDSQHTACRRDPEQCASLERRASNMQRGFTGLGAACRDIGAASHPSELVGMSASWQPSARPGAHWVEGACVLE